MFLLVIIAVLLVAAAHGSKIANAAQTLQDNQTGGPNLAPGKSAAKLFRPSASPAGWQSLFTFRFPLNRYRTPGIPISSIGDGGNVAIQASGAPATLTVSSGAIASPIPVGVSSPTTNNVTTGAVSRPSARGLLS